MSRKAPPSKNDLTSETPWLVPILNDDELDKLLKIPVAVNLGFGGKKAKSLKSKRVFFRLSSNDEPKIDKDRIALEELLDALDVPKELGEGLAQHLHAYEDRITTPAILKKARAGMITMIAASAAHAWKVANRSVSNDLLHGGYKAHRSKFESATAYLKAAYANRLGLEGDLDQATLWKLDPSLMRQLDLDFKGDRRAELRKLLPTRSERMDARLKAQIGYVPAGQERKLAVTLLSKGQHPKPKGG